MRAMLNQLDPVTVMTQFNKIAAAGKEVVATDVPTSDANTLVDLALSARTRPIASVSFTPPAIYPGSPDFAKIKTMVQAKINAAEAADQPKPQSPTTQAAPTTGSGGAASTKPSPSKASSGSSTASSSTKAAAEEDLDSVCTVS